MDLERSSSLDVLCFFMVTLSSFAPIAAFCAEIADGNGGFEMNGFVESPGQPDLDASASPGHIDSWAYSRGTSPLAALARGGQNYETREGSYMLGLGSVQDVFPNVALTSMAFTTITGLSIGEDYALAFWYAPGYVVSGPTGELILGSETDSTATADLLVQLTTSSAEVAVDVYSAIPSEKTTPTPRVIDWRMGSLIFTAPATELDLTISAIPAAGDTPDDRNGFYFVDDVTIFGPGAIVDDIRNRCLFDRRGDPRPSKEAGSR